MTPTEKRDAVRRCRDDLRVFGKHCLQIKDKQGKTLPFLLNRAQRYVHEQIEAQRAKTGRVRAIVLKGRQQGLSTYIAARFYWHCALEFGQKAFILAHEQKATDNLYKMVRRFHDGNPLAPSTGTTNAKELVFDKLDGGYSLATAGTKDVGRSHTAQYLHGSEVGFWDNAETHLAGIGNTVADMDGTEIILESTANGLGNKFHQLWQDAVAGENEWLPIFVPWFWQDEYIASTEGFVLTPDEAQYQSAYDLSPAQMAWRRNKVKTYGSGFEWLFDQEFPGSPELAFRSATSDPLISPTTVSAAANSPHAEDYGALVIGCDPAEYGPDRTSIVYRKGRVVRRIEMHKGKGPMEVAGLLAEAWKAHRPDALFVDRIGIGAGIVDRLKELGVPVIGVNSAESPSDKELYANKRAEMWWRMKAWLEDTPCRLPNDPELIADLSAPSYRYNSSGLRLVESKDDMRKRGIRSPDGADALALTFSETVISRAESGTHFSSGYTGHKPASRAGY